MGRKDLFVWDLIDTRGYRKSNVKRDYLQEGHKNKKPSDVQEYKARLESSRLWR